MQDPTQDSGQDKAARIRRVQYEIVIAEADLKKKNTEKEAEMMRLRGFKTQLSRIQTEIAACDERMKKIDNDKMLMENDLKSLKKKMNEIV